MAEIETGIPVLDDDLRVLFAMQERGELSALRDILANPKLTETDFDRRVPAALLRLSMGLLAPGNFKEMTKLISESSRPLLEQARQVLSAELSNLQSHALAQKRLRQLSRPEPFTAPLVQSMHVITRVHSIDTWLGTPPNLRPAVQVAFADKEGALLLNTLLDWDDLFFVAYSLLKVAAQSMDRGKPLFEHGQIKFEDEWRIPERIRDIGQALAKIQALAPYYGLLGQASTTTADRQNEPTDTAPAAQ